MPPVLISDAFSYALSALQTMLSVSLCIYLAVWHYRERRRAKDAKSWPRAEATINSASVGFTSNEGAIEWYVRVSYYFTVEGNFYGWYTNRTVSTETAGVQYALGLNGKTFPVRYQPGNPDISVVLDPEWSSAVPCPSLSAAD